MGPRAPRSRRRRAAAVAGHEGDAVAARRLLADPDGDVRATALSALARAGALTHDDLAATMGDPAPVVRRRVAEECGRAPAGVRVPLLGLLDDPDPSVVEMAAWACGEIEPAESGVVDALSRLVEGHDDALVREAGAAALGAIGDPRGLPAILAATRDRPTVRRRAILALAPFEGREVDEVLARARTDRDPQVRQAAEHLSTDLG